MNLRCINEIDPEEFESLVFRFLWRFGVANLEKYGGTGDRGRDLTGTTEEQLLPGVVAHRKWIIQCKRRKSSLRKAELLDELAGAVQHGPDYYLLVGTFSITSDTRDWLADIQRSYSFKILIADSQTLNEWFAVAPDIAFDFLRTTGPRLYTQAMKALIEGVRGEKNTAPPVLQIFSEALGEACNLQSLDINSMHLLVAISARQDCRSGQFLKAAGANTLALKALSSTTRRDEPPSSKVPVNLSKNLILSLRRATAAAAQRKERVNDLDLLAGLLYGSSESASGILASVGASAQRLRLLLESVNDSANSSKYPGIIAPRT